MANDKGLTRVEGEVSAAIIGKETSRPSKTAPRQKQLDNMMDKALGRSPAVIKHVKDMEKQG
jgi:hypothetical protein